MSLQQTFQTNSERLLRLGRHGAIDPPRFFVLEEKRLVFIDNPKVASTSIKQVLYPDLDYNALGQDGFHAALEPRSSAQLPSAAAEYRFVFVARDPFSRLVAAFRDKIEGRAPSDWGVFNTRFFLALFRHVGRLHLTDDPVPFPAFAMAVTRIPDWLSDRHIASQSRWMRALPKGAKVDVLQFESIADDWTRFADANDLAHLPRLNATPDDDWQQLYRDETLIAAIAARYKSDLALFGYVPPQAAA